MGIDLNPFDWPGDLIKFAESSPPFEDLINFALKQILGFDPPWALIRLVKMLGGDVWSAAQQAVGLWWRMESAGLDPWQLLGGILDGIANFGPGGYIHDRIREFWRPLWQAMDTLEAPTKGVETFVYAVQDALNTEMQRMLDGQHARATDTVTVDNSKLQAALTDLASRWTQNRQANGVLHDALYTYIPDAAGVAANGVDLIELIFFVAAVVATDGVALLATPEFLGILFDEDYDIFAAAIIAGYDALGVWLAAQNLDLNPLPKQIAEVAANPPVAWIPAALTNDEKILEGEGCPIDAIRSFMSNPQITEGYIHDIVREHAKEACVILSSLDTILRSPNQIAFGGLSTVEDTLRLLNLPNPDGSSTPQSGKFRGSLFAVQWLAQHPNQLTGIEPPVVKGERPDALLSGGIVVECKSVATIDSADFIAQATSELAQVSQYDGQAYTKLQFVFDGDKLINSGDPQAALRAMLRIQAAGFIVDVTFSPDVAAKNAAYIQQLENNGVGVEQYSYLSE